ncbi:hypothetical protein Pfo_012622 [Paulownia fortunei]|nr:hypothetical protein Pfo_012622 [Paulownia fortunei]
MHFRLQLVHRSRLHAVVLVVVFKSWTESETNFFGYVVLVMMSSLKHFGEVALFEMLYPRSLEAMQRWWSFLQWRNRCFAPTLATSTSRWNQGIGLAVRRMLDCVTKSTKAFSIRNLEMYKYAHDTIAQLVFNIELTFSHGNMLSVRELSARSYCNCSLALIIRLMCRREVFRRVKQTYDGLMILFL